MRLLEDIRTSYELALSNTSLSKGEQESVLRTVDDYIDNHYTEDVSVGLDIDGVPYEGTAFMPTDAREVGGRLRTDIIIVLPGLISDEADRVLRLISEEYDRAAVAGGEDAIR